MTIVIVSRSVLSEKVRGGKAERRFMWSLGLFVGVASIAAVWKIHRPSYVYVTFVTDFGPHPPLSLLLRGVIEIRHTRFDGNAE
jgi:hypothetical protein